MKRKGLRRLLALTLCVALTACATACGGSGGNAESKENQEQGAQEQSAQKETEDEETGEAESPGNQGTDAADGEIPLDYFAGTELTIAVIKMSADKGDGYDEKPIVKKAEEATGIHINWIEIEDTVKDERKSTMLAGGELPDAFLGIMGNDDVVQNEELFYDISQDGLLETYAPDVLRDYEQGGQGVLEMLTLSDGSIRSLAGNIGSSRDSEPVGIMMINKAWLDQLNLEIPATADEFYQVLCAFRDNDMNGDGDATDEIPLSFANSNWAGNFINFANSFGIAGYHDGASSYYLMLEDGKVNSTMDTENYRAFLEFYHKLAQEGLLDVEGFSQSNEQYEAKIAEGKVGCMVGWDTASEDYVGMRPFQGMDGVEVRKSGVKNYFFGMLTSLVPTAECSNVEALLHWWNYLSSSVENKYMARFGEEDVSWYRDAEGNYFIGAETPEEGVNYTELAYTVGLGNVTSPYIPPYELGSEFKEDSIRGRMVLAVEDLLMDEYPLPRMVPSEKVEERAFIETDLFTYIGNFGATSVLEGITDESWEQYLEGLRTYQYYEWLDWWQDYVDKAF